MIEVENEDQYLKEKLLGSFASSSQSSQFTDQEMEDKKKLFDSVVRSKAHLHFGYP